MTDISYQGIIKIPITAVIKPALTNEIRFGFKLEKSLEGETTFTSILVESWATKITIIAKSMTKAASNLLIKSTGFGIASP